MSRRTRNRIERNVCPSCGCSWQPIRAPRKGGRYRSGPERYARPGRGPAVKPIRVYFYTKPLISKKNPVYRGATRDLVTCGDPWHDEQRAMRDRKETVVVSLDVFKPLKPEEAKQRRRSKGRRHRARQDKARR